MKLGKTYFSGSITFDEGNNVIGPSTATFDNVTISNTLNVTGNIQGAATTASYIEYSDVANKPSLISSSAQLIGQTIDGDLTVGGILTAQEFHTEFVSASIVYQSGSTQFGNSSDDTHVFTGSLGITGNLSVNTNALFVDSQNKRASIGGVGGDAFTVFNSGYPLIKFIDGSTTRGLLGYVFDWGHYAIQSEGDLAFRTGTSGGSLKMVLDTNGNLGVGTTSPTYKLDIDSVSGARIKVATGGYNWLNLVSGYSSNFSIGLNDSGGSGALGIYQYDSSGTFVRSAINLISDGNVGIGTNGPRQKLNVNGHIESMANFGLKASYNNTDAYHGSLSWATLQLGNNGDNRIIGGRTATGGNLKFYVNNTNDATQYSTTPDGTLAMTIASDGNVGIGTTSSPVKLAVRGGILALNSANGSSDSGVYISPTNENTINSGYGADAENRDIWLNYRGYNDGFTRFRDVRIGNGKGNAFAFFQGSTQYIGFGTESPSAKLHVDNGPVKHTQLTGAGWMTVNRFKIDQSSFSNPDIVLVSNAVKTGSYPQIAIFIKLNGRGVSANYAQFTQAYATVAVDANNDLTDLKTATISHTTLGPAAGAGTFSISGGSLRFTPNRQTNYDGYSIEVNINSRDCTFDI